jgi:putative transcriptional regulator
MYSLLYIIRGILKLENNLREFRFHHNEISQQDLANAVGVTRLTIHSIETGKFNPSTLLALKIAKFFNANLEDIFYLVEDDQEQ